MARKIKFKTIPWGDGSKNKLSFKQQIITVLRRPSKPQGMDYAEVELRVAIIRKINEVEENKELILEDADWREVSTAFKSFAFPAAIEAIVELGEAIEEAETVSLSSLKGNDKKKRKRVAPSD